jgi:arabinogalactan oligomer/maltooligosaccharide transport system permease protein
MKKLISWLTILFFCGFSLFPIFYVISISLRGDNAFGSRSLVLIDASSTLKNFIELFTSTPFLLWLKNSLYVSGVVTLVGVVLAATSGYAISRYEFKGRKFMLMSLITTQMFPATMLMLPFFIVLSKLHLINKFLGLIIIYSSTALPFCIWQMKGYFDTIPKELEEAARLDGCSPFQIFYKIILPISLPALVITGLFSFMSSWSEYLVAAITLQDPELYTLPLGLKSFQASLATQWGLYAAGALVVSIPVVVLFIMISKYLVSGLTVGSVKG